MFMPKTLVVLPLVLACADPKPVEIETQPGLESIDSDETGSTDSSAPTEPDNEDNEDNEDTEDTGTDAPPDTDPPADDSGTPEPPADPASTGSRGVSVIDASGIEAKLYIPDGGGPLPIVVFSPGFQLNPSDYETYAEHFASWGYVTVLVDFDDSLFGGPTHADHDATIDSVIDWIEGDPAELGGMADSGSIALAGHSMGGKISLLRGSQDARVDLLIGIDPVDSGPPFGGSDADYPSVAPERMGGISVPMLLIGEQNNAVGSLLSPACAPEGENFRAYYQAAAAPVLEVDFTTASHMSFVDNPACLVCLACPVGTDNPAVTKRHVRAIATAFLEWEFRDAAWAETWLNSGGLSDLAATGLVSTRSKNGF
jgi:acetyl esterase/lipase